MTETFTFTGADGQEIFTRAWRTAETPKAVIQIAHGMAEHGARYERFATALNAAGYSAYVNDQRGHGKTVPDSQVLGDMGDGGWMLAVRDLNLLAQKIQADNPEVPVLLMGHSMGSFLTQHYLAEFPASVQGAALSSTNGPPGALGKVAQALARLEKLRLGAQGHSPVMAGMTFKAFNKPFAPNRTDFDWLSRDEAEVDKYVADPLCGFDCSVATWIGVLDALTVIASDTNLSRMNRDLPIYVFSGTEDPVGEKTKGVKRLLDAYAAHHFSAVTHKFYDGGRHEMLNEINRDEVTTDFIVWANSVIG